MGLKWVWSQAIRMLEQRVVIVNEVPPSPPTQVFTIPAALPPTVTFKVETTSSLEMVISSVSAVAVGFIGYGEYVMKKEMKRLEDNDEKGQNRIRSLEVKKEKLKMKISDEKERAASTKSKLKISDEKERAASTKSKLWFFQKLGSLITAGIAGGKD